MRFLEITTTNIHFSKNAGQADSHTTTKSKNAKRPKVVSSLKPVNTNLRTMLDFEDYCLR